MTDQAAIVEQTPGPKPQSGFSGADIPAYDDYAHCVHCGLCLNHCPTYKLWGLEADSPRGRIRQIVLVDQGRLPLGDSFVKHIDQCLDCRACETACPSGVEYGKLVEAARAQIEQNYRRPFFSRLARDFVFRGLLPYPKRIALLARLLYFYQRSGLQSLARATGILRLLGLADREKLLPPIDRTFFFSKLGRTYAAVGQRRARVALFAGCVAQVSFSALHEATIRVLTANGCEVVVPAGQTCCGALAAHAGVRDVARSLARTNLDVFLGDEFDAVITNAAGCGSTLKEYEHLFAAGTAEQDKAHAFRKKMRDVDRIPRRSRPHRATCGNADARHLSGFLPSSARAKSSGSPAETSARDPGIGTRRNGHGGLLLRVRRLLQRHRDANFARAFSGKDEACARHKRAGNRHGKSRLPAANARWGGDSFDGSGSRARHGIARPRAGEEHLIRISQSHRLQSLAFSELTKSKTHWLKGPGSVWKKRAAVA